MRTLPTALAVLGSALALPAAADAATTLGSHPDGILDDVATTTCPAGCTIVQDWEANLQLRVPERGVVTLWRVRGDAGQARIQRVALSGSTGSAVAATDAVALTGALQEIPAALPVQAGDALGLALSAGGSVDSADLGFGESTVSWQPALDATPRAGSAAAGEVIAFQAVVEPDADADGLGDETQDPCVNCNPGGGNPPPPDGGTPPPGDGGDPAPEQPADPYAAIRKSGPKATIAGKATRKGRKVAVTVTNPHAFAIKGKLQLKRGRKVVATKALRLDANAGKTVKLTVKGKVRALKAVATLRGPVGKAKTTTKALKLTTTKPPKPGKGGVDGTYKGAGGGDAGWVMVIEDGIVQSFTGQITIHCTKAGENELHTFAMIGDDPKPSVAADGSFAWEATSGYGFDKLKFSGRVSGSTVTGNMMAESRPLVQGVSPVTGLPRLEPEYCFAGRDFTLQRK